MYEDYLMHHGVLGMKWGVRRYQNSDGSYTKKGLERYRKSEAKYKEAKARVRSYKAKNDDNLRRYAERDVSIEKKYSKNGRLTDEGYKKIFDSAAKYDNERIRLKNERRQAKSDMKAAKKEMNKNYKQLKKDYKADQGKELYSKGKTISSLSVAGFVRALGITAVANIGIIAANNRSLSLITKNGDVPVAAIIKGIGYAGLATNLIKTEMDKSKVRAYYAH